MEVGRDLTLAEALSSLREQLLDAVEQARGEDLVLTCQGVEVELLVTATTTAKGEVKAGLWRVVTVGGGLDHASAATHRVKLTLVPEFAARPSRKVQIGDVD